MTPARIVTTIVCASIAVACGAAEPEPRSPESQGGAAKSTTPQGDQDRDKVQQQAVPGQPAPPPPPTQPGGREYAQPPQSSQMPSDPWLEFQSAQIQMNASTSDCAVACKALASIDRATGHVCAMTAASDHCTTARETLKSARRKVRAECTVCPQGPSVDPDGPIPSVP
jgi:hypothetical protein